MNERRPAGRVDERQREAEEAEAAARRQARADRKAEERRWLEEKRRESEAKLPQQVPRKTGQARRDELIGMCELCGTDGPVTATDEGDFCAKCLAKIGVAR